MPEKRKQIVTSSCCFDDLTDDCVVYLFSWIPLPDLLPLQLVNQQWNRCIYKSIPSRTNRLVISIRGSSCYHRLSNHPRVKTCVTSICLSEPSTQGSKNSLKAKRLNDEYILPYIKRITMDGLERLGVSAEFKQMINNSQYNLLQNLREASITYLKDGWFPCALFFSKISILKLLVDYSMPELSIHDLNRLINGLTAARLLEQLTVQRKLLEKILKIENRPIGSPPVPIFSSVQLLTLKDCSFSGQSVLNALPVYFPNLATLSLHAAGIEDFSPLAELDKLATLIIFIDFGFNSFPVKKVKRMISVKSVRVVFKSGAIDGSDEFVVNLLTVVPNINSVAIIGDTFNPNLLFNHLANLAESGYLKQLTYFEANFQACMSCIADEQAQNLQVSYLYRFLTCGKISLRTLLLDYPFSVSSLVDDCRIEEIVRFHRNLSKLRLSFWIPPDEEFHNKFKRVLMAAKNDSLATHIEITLLGRLFLGNPLKWLPYKGRWPVYDCYVFFRVIAEHFWQEEQIAYCQREISSAASTNAKDIWFYIKEKAGLCALCRDSRKIKS